MKLGIMQPYFFPYLGYFDLINRTDRWIVFDVVKYAPKSWMNRNRVLDPSKDWQYINVPVDRHVGEGRICDVTVIEAKAAHARILGQLLHYRKARAPYYTPVTELVNEAFASHRGKLLRDLNLRTLLAVCNYLGIEINYDILSEMHLTLPAIDHAGQWALEIAGALGAREYINPPSGRDIFREADWRARGIDLSFTKPLDYHYPSGSYTFVERLSILDVLMWNAPDAVKAHLDSLAAQATLEKISGLSRMTSSGCPLEPGESIGT